LIWIGFFFRFDLIFLILDPANDIYDRRLGRHMISLYFQKPEEADADLLVGFTWPGDHATFA